MSEVLVLDACRTPRGRGKPGRGALSAVHPQEFLATLLRAIPDRTGLDPAAVDDVVAGVVSQVGEQGANLARLAALAAGWPDTVPGVTLNRMCGSGLQAVAFAAGAVAAGHAELVAAGGAESLSRVPFLSDGAWLDGRNPALAVRLPMAPQGVCADLLAALEGISREELDAFALESQQRAARAIAEKRFAPSLVPVRDAGGRVLLAADEHPRPETTAAALAALPPAFAEAASRPPVPGAPPPRQALRARYPEARDFQPVHTAGNSSGIVDGAGLLLLASPAAAARHGLRPRARLRACASAAADPVLMFTATVPAIEKGLAQADMAVADIDLWEINEAFAVVPLQVMAALGLEHDQVNVNGGAIALGHPLGATGAILLGTLLDEMERRDAATGCAALCVGGGMGVAAILERLPGDGPGS